ncbi:MAG: TIGR00266 family protein [Nanobdellota archaeon]
MVKFKIRGKDMPILDVELSKDESVFTEAGGMAWMSPNISMDSNVRGGLGKGIARMFSGESLFMVNYACKKGKGAVSFCMESPGRIVEFDFNKRDVPIICQRDAFMVAEDTVKLSTHFTKRLGAGFFGGEGFFLQKIEGSGKAFLELPGEITEYDLKEGQSLKVDPGYIGAFEEGVSYSIGRVKGIKNIFFGGEGLFLATLTGPGKVWLQSMPFPVFARKITPYIPKKS